VPSFFQAKWISGLCEEARSVYESVGSVHRMIMTRDCASTPTMLYVDRGQSV
jgi:hypothetical protein